MNYASINIQGNIISSEILDKIRSEEKFKHQSPESFGLSRSASLRDEIGLAWSILRTHWQAYKKRLETLPKGDTGTSLTREKWILPLLTEIGYQVSILRAQQVNGKSYAISHGASNRDNFPVHIMGYRDSLDKRRETGGPRLSPHALVQEYLNSTEHLFALVTNGRHLRLLRDATRLVRMSYLEFDLERMFEEELYADFSILYRVLHISRMPEQMDEGPDSVIEYYHQESMASGTRIREKLSEAVEVSIKTLANGFLLNRSNEDLSQQFENDSLKADDYYMYQLRLIYRVLFLIVLEERQLIYPEELDEEGQRKRNIYYKYYSVERLRRLTESRVYVDGDKVDIWESLKTTFLLFENGFYGEKLGIKPLGSGLFAPNALGGLMQCQLKNSDLLEVVKRLTTFINKQGQLVRVNYSDLDVEEFGSVYEGLLEYDPKVEKLGAKWQFSFVEGTGRSSSGSHYTPEELVKPLIKHSLDYIIAYKLKEPNPEEALLSITVCDVACGSGHILLAAARRIATELASLRENAEQPSPTFYRVAIRDVIRNCIYGVDLNPLAVELCKVALWLEAHNPNEPLNFLDHHIKNGNAIVGLAHFEELENGIATEAFKTLPGDDKDVVATLRKKNAAERKTKAQLGTYDLSKVDDSLKSLRKEFADFTALPESTPEEIAAKATAYQKLTNGAKWWRLKNLADLQIAQFFIPKTIENKKSLTTDKQYRTYLNGGAQILDRGASLAKAEEKKFFHWFLEFPEVFGRGGFDCILGNPPFLGGKRISGHFGDGFLNYIKVYFDPAIGGLDLVAYFFRRIFIIQKASGFLALISTNTISQGDTRKGGLVEILKNGGTINFAVKSMKWPGLAAVDVSLITVYKGVWSDLIFLNNRRTNLINSYLDDQKVLGDPKALISNSNKSFVGSVVNGDGFVLEVHKALNLLNSDDKNSQVVFPYLNGRDLNNNIAQNHSRWIINFHDWDEMKASKYQEPFKIVQELVKPQRSLVKRKIYREKWWIYAERGAKLYETIESNNIVMVVAKTTKYPSFIFSENNKVFSQDLTVFSYENPRYFAVLNSTFLSEWAWKNTTTMGSSTLRLNPTAVFETFPLPEKSRLNHLENIGELYYNNRQEVLTLLKLGLTKTYNQFHNRDLTNDLEPLEAKTFEKKYGKETLNLYNNIKVKKEGEISFKEAVTLIFKLRELHKEMDEAVLVSYGWHEDSEKWGKAIQLRHDFYEVDYLPENDRVRYTIHPEARKEVLKRLLLLNHERFEEEVAQGLHKKKDVEAYYHQKGKPVPEGTIFSDRKISSKKSNNKKMKTDKAQSTLNL
ncbi:Eco57I restriction-modification methylase domain-containing protein [Zeaxanthinibacter enoshimensis]|uniref:site-specific DNA-methyltransferase (adenine-specific) n=1 Tax=Zeaxanthinibacter enoshimensis TaxID=392009 RepID=A0A4R6TSS8_9FLAO|nr:DNA methyltransferase [Zeaxanthinibacter enoshimensis]TDQ33377.1 N-6 DNA methylase [Zeaxanthinibacter enoshimensis]